MNRRSYDDDPVIIIRTAIKYLQLLQGYIVFTIVNPLRDPRSVCGGDYSLLSETTQFSQARVRENGNLMGNYELESWL